MPMHPAAPDDLHGLVAAYQGTANAVIDLGTSCRDADFELPTECPGWTVKDQISHIVGSEKRLAGHPTPRAEVTDQPHIRNKNGLINEQDVEARRHLPGHEVVAELAAYLPQRMAQLHHEASLEVVVGGALGPDMTLREHLTHRIMEVWCHEQDIRAALHRPGDLDTPAAAVFTAGVLEALPRIVAHDAGVTPGHAVILDVTGPLLARDGARVCLDEQGRPCAEALFSGHDRHDGPEPEDVTTIHLTTEALTRRASGRRATEAITFTVTGDEQTARAVLDALVIMQ